MEKTRERLATFINYKWTEVGIAILILISVVLVFVEATMVRSSHYFNLVENLNDALTLIFVVELSIRFYVEKKKKRFFKSYWLDIIAVLPSFRVLRALRVVRLFRVGVIFVRHFRPMRAGGLIKREYLVVFSIVFISILVGSIAMRFAEGRANEDLALMEQTLWFATMTLVAGEPVGAEPVTEVGKVITLILMMGGLTVFAIFTGTVSAFMTESIHNFRIRHMELEELNGHLVICGWNPAGPRIIKEVLANPNEQIVVVSERERLFEDPWFDPYLANIHHVCGDFTRLDILNEARIAQANFAILLSDESVERSAQDQDARSVLAALLIEKLSQGIFTSVQLHNRDNETSLKSAGVEEIIITDDYVGNIMATVVRSHGIVSVLDELLTVEHGHQFFKTKTPDALVGSEFIEGFSEFKVEHDATIIAIERASDHQIVVNPPSSYIFAADDVLFFTANKPIS